MYKTKIFFILIHIVFFSSCNLRDRGGEKIVENAEALIEQNPDSLLFILEMKVYPNELNEDYFHRYQLLNIQAKSKNSKDISNDTIIYQVKEYFIKRGDTGRASQSLFYCGRISALQGKKEVAMHHYLDAEVYAKKVNDYALLGLINYYIGDLYFHQFLKGEAIPKYKESLFYFNKAGKYKNEIIAYGKIGSCFLIRGETDSSFYYYNKSLSLAKLHEDSTELVFIHQNIGIALEKSGDLAGAREYYRQSIGYANNNDEKAKVYLNMAYLFLKQENKDSTQSYFDKSLALIQDQESSMLRANIYQILAKMSEKDKDYKQALQYNKEYIKHLNKALKEIGEQAILEVQKKYDFELVQNENNRLLIYKQSAFLIIFGLVIAILILVFIFHRKTVKNKEALADANQKISYLKDMADSFDEKENTFRGVLFQHFDILKKVALLEGSLKAEEKRQGQKLLDKFNEIVYNQGALDWNMIYTTMHQLYKGFPDLLRKKYPELDETEFRICCLTYAGLSNAEISVIMEFSVNTIQARKSIIRKKLNMDGYGNLMDFLSTNIK